MKKLLLSLILCLPILVLAAENQVVTGVDEPQWKDFAPVAYVNVKEPKGFAKFNDTGVYWYKRRVEFESGIERCRETSQTEDRVACYQKLKVKQYAKNSDYNARLEAMDNERKMPQSMQNPTSNMLDLNNTVNTFMNMQPNEFR